MTPRSLHDLLARLEQPFDVDALRRYMSEVQAAAEREHDALAERIPEAGEALDEAAGAASDRAEEVAQVDRRTRGGVVATFLSSVDSDGVEQARNQAERALAGDLGVLDLRIADARALADRAVRLAATAERGATVLEGLRTRAAAADVAPAKVATIAPAWRVLDALPAHLAGLPARLDAPIQRALAAAEQAGGVLTALRTSGRASTVGEAVLDGVVPPDSGALGQRLRRGAAESAAGWVPDLERRRLSEAEAAAELEAGRGSLRDRARRDAEARLAADAELDALERDG
jgi:hypothetical protein